MFCRFGSLVLTYGSLYGPCHYVRLSRRFSLLVFVCRAFTCTGRFRWQFVVLSVGSSVWGPAFSLPVFSFLVSFCGAMADLLFSALVCCFLVWSAVSDVVVPLSTMRYACTSFLFFPGACHYLRLSLLFLSIRFHSLSLRCFERFHLRFVYLDRSSSIFGIRLFIHFSFSSVFRPAVSQVSFAVTLVLQMISFAVR